jgi:hypothetical protein
MSLSRNNTQEFARRVRDNLDFIIQNRGANPQIHEVTQLVISLLGIVVFPWEDGALSHLEDMSITEMGDKGWPPWTIVLDSKGDTLTLGTLVRHIRNAAAHRRISFSSDLPDLKSVTITFEDQPNRKAPVTWHAEIKASDLMQFCNRFTRELESLVG